jgi:predicted nucleic acid-binding Zn ribbon protein
VTGAEGGRPDRAAASGDRHREVRQAYGPAGEEALEAALAEPARLTDPVPFGAALDRLTARPRWRRRLDDARVHEVWAQIAGPAVAAHTTPVRLSGGVLVVRVDSASWATQLRYLSGELLSRANTVLGEGRVTRITVVTGPADRSAHER